jgi:hypothetical protein
LHATSLSSLSIPRRRACSLAKAGPHVAHPRYTAIYSGLTFLAYAIVFPATQNLLLQIFYRTDIQGQVRPSKTTRTHGPLYSSSIRPSQQDSLLYTQFSRTHSSSISSSIHSIYYRTHLSLSLNISMCDLVLKDLLRRI